MPDLPLADDNARYRAASGRDARWDGLLYLGVTTTGIYCRPSCPARKPLPQNCTYFSSAAACVAAGFRACKRCRPDSLPGSRHWDARSDLCARAVTLIRDGVVDEVGVSGLAARLAVSERQLTRVLSAELGASAQQLNRTRRAHAARSLIEQTAMPLSDVAFAAGFGSVRQFNDVMRAEFGVAPSSYRRVQGDRGASDGQPVSDEPSEIVLRLRCRPPFTSQPLRRFLAAHAVVGLDQISENENTHTRVIQARGGLARATVVWGEHSTEVPVRIRLVSLS
ncbi:MAG: bifunctional transcriptional activator/DNA repair enzyme AdaA, partial [Mycetocola sp.]